MPRREKKSETAIVETTARRGMSLIPVNSARGHMRLGAKEQGGVNAAIFIAFLKRPLAGASRASYGLRSI
ncbi:MAG: hypothetical protein ACREDJ_04155 [Methylocella sp.]